MIVTYSTDERWRANAYLLADRVGGTKAWIRFPRAGDCLLPGSFLEPSPEERTP